jgi:hypothetical protein
VDDDALAGPPGRPDEPARALHVGAVQPLPAAREHIGVAH